MSTFEIAGGDDGCYGPRFGPAIADALGEVPSVDGGHMLLALREPLHIDGKTICLISVRARYVGDSLETIRGSGATVGVWRVLPEGEGTARQGLTPANSEYWAIGTCKPL